MAEKENIAPPLTRAAAKRAASAAAIAAAAPVPSRPPTKRNRVALAELRFLSNTTSRRAASDRSVPRSKGKPKTRKKAKLRTAASSDEITPPGDPQMGTSYASDICQYLRSMEVCGSMLLSGWIGLVRASSG